MSLIEALRQVVAQPQLQIAVVLEVGADNMSVVQFPDGSQQRVRGTSVAIGSPAFVRSGLIEGLAPALSAVTIEI